MRVVSQITGFSTGNSAWQSEGLAGIGYVSSSDALPLMQMAALPQHLRTDSWAAVSCQSYASMARQILSGKLAGGLMPFEVMASDLLSNPAAANQWQAVAVQARASWEFLLGKRGRRALAKTVDDTKNQGGRSEFRVAIGGHLPAIRQRINGWVRKHHAEKQIKPSYHILPIKLMGKALQDEAVDALVLPAPWGSVARSLGLGSLEVVPKKSELNLGMVLVMARDAALTKPSLAEQIYADLKSVRSETTKLNDVQKAEVLMQRALLEGVSLIVLMDSMKSADAAEVYQKANATEHFSVRLEWLAKMGIWSAQGADITEIASGLTR